MPTPTPAPAPTPAPYIAYQDNFNDSNSGWLILSNETGDRGYLGGEYRILINKPNRSVVVPYVDSSFSDIDFQVRSRHEGAAVSKGYGLVFRSEDASNYYVLEIDPVNGVYRFRKRERASWLSITDWTSSPHIMLGTTPNVLRVIARGSRFELYVNGGLLNTAVDGNFQVGHIGLFAGNGPDPNGAAFFIR